jgi:GNAT superfamily N-acetyltransferase
VTAVEIRPYEPSDIQACRALYAELVEHHRAIYDDPSIGGDDPGAGFDEYLVRPERVVTWVATDSALPVGLTGLLWENGEATVEPVVVTRDRRRAGIGQLLLRTAVDEARRRGATDVNINPVARNVEAIRAFQRAGFRTLGHLQLFMSLDREPAYWRDGIEVHETRFDY